MNKLISFIIIMCLTSCIGKYKTDAQQATITQVSASETTGDTLHLDLSASEVLWKGTKMGGAGKHEGRIQLSEGYFLSEDNQLTGGRFFAAMNTIEVSDIPKHEPIPRKRLNDHLKSTDFFNADEYPYSQFEITSVRRLPSDSLEISGNLTIKDIQHGIRFPAMYTNKILTAVFTIDRHQWNVAYTGSWVDKTFVDKDIALEIRLESAAN
jgi:polyisoprenoid-binding protein YceI